MKTFYTLILLQMIKLFKWPCICLLLLSGGVANAQFHDNDARNFILNLREKMRVESTKFTEDIKRISEENKKANDFIAKLQQSVRDVHLDSKDQIDRIKTIQFEQNRILNNVNSEIEKNTSQLLFLKSENTRLEQNIQQLKIEIDSLKSK